MAYRQIRLASQCPNSMSAQQMLTWRQCELRVAAHIQALQLLAHLACTAEFLEGLCKNQVQAP